MEYREFVKMMFQKHKGKPAKDIMRMASVEWKKQKGGASPKGKKTKGAGIGMDMMAPFTAIANFEKRLAGKGIGQNVEGSHGGMYTAGSLDGMGMTAGKMRKSKKMSKKEQAGNFLDDVLGGVGSVLDVGTKFLPFLPHLV